MMQWYRGVRMCSCQVATFPMLEARLRDAGLITTDLTGLIYQGGYNAGGVAASAGTHDGGGALDVRWSLCSDAAVRIFRRCGIAYWPRPTMKPPHGHGIWIGCPHVSSGAAAQVAQYRAGLNGLAGRGRDTYPRPGVVTWQTALAAWEAEKPVDPIIGDTSRGSLLPAP